MEQLPPAVSWSYVPPLWGSLERGIPGFSLDVLKQGCVIDNIDISTKGHHIFGRIPEYCDTTLDHPSISRKHAVLQFDREGIQLFIKDLGSTYGTKVNKKSIEKETFELLHVGDMIRFGESTRMYLVCGPSELLPEEYESERLRSLRQKIARASNSNISSENEGATWGFHPDAEEVDEAEEVTEESSKLRANAKYGMRRETVDDPNLPSYLRNLPKEESAYESLIDPADVHEKDRVLFEQLQRRVQKLENLKLEKRRIMAKEMDQGGLTEGQANAIDRNDKRIAALGLEIEKLEDSILKRNSNRNNTNSAKKKVLQEEEYDTEDDDFYDRTDKKSKRMKVQLKKEELTKIETMESLHAQLNSIQHQEMELQKKRKLAVEVLAESQKTVELDPLDVYMVESSASTQKAGIMELDNKLALLEAKKMKLSQLVSIATPALVGLGVKSTKDTVPSISNEDMHSEKKETPDEKIESLNTTTMERPNESHVLQNLKKNIITTVESGLPELGQKPVDPPIVISASSSSACTASISFLSSEKEREKTVPSYTSTLNAQERESTMTPLIASRKVEKRIKEPSNFPLVSNYKEKSSFKSTDTLESGECIWVPPKSQTGDGRTSLNDKYGY